MLVETLILLRRIFRVINLLSEMPNDRRRDVVVVVLDSCFDISTVLIFFIVVCDYILSILNVHLISTKLLSGTITC